MKTTANPEPWLAMIDVPEDGRYYLKPPVELMNYNPAIHVFRGVIVLAYIIPSRMDNRSVYSVGSEATCRRARELIGIRCALDIMGEIWSGLLVKIDGARNDIEVQNDIVKELVGTPLGAFAMIKASGKLGQSGMPQKAANCVRNVLAFAHWGAIWEIRKKGKGVMLNGTPRPGEIHWDCAAALMNQIFRDAFPGLAKRHWQPFTGSTLCKLVERAVILDPKSGV